MSQIVGHVGEKLLLSVIFEGVGEHLADFVG